MVGRLTEKRCFFMAKPRADAWYLGEHVFQQWDSQQYWAIPNPPPRDLKGQYILYDVAINHRATHYIPVSQYVTDIIDGCTCYMALWISHSDCRLCHWHSYSSRGHFCYSASKYRTRFSSLLQPVPGTSIARVVDAFASPA